MNPIQSLVDALSAFGVPGVLTAVGILIAVFLAKRSGLVATGNQARMANLILSALLYGLSDNPDAEKAIMALLASLLAALSFTALEWVSSKYSKSPAG